MSDPQSARPLTERLWDILAGALTTPPRRGEREPIVVREELDYHPVVDDVPLAVRAEIEAHPRLFPGVRVGSTSRRVYYDSGLAPQIVGVRLPVTDDDLALRRANSSTATASASLADDPLDYRPSDRIGRTGVEASYDSCLRGLRGLRKLTRNRYGEIVGEQIVRASLRRRQHRIDAQRQRAAQDAAAPGRPSRKPNEIRPPEERIPEG